MNESKPGDLPVFDELEQQGFDFVVATVMMKILAVAPYLTVIKFGVKKLVEYVLFYAWDPLQNFIAEKIIDRIWKQKATQYQAAVDDLDRVLEKQPDLNSEEVKKAHEEFKKKLGDLIRIKT